MLPRGRRFLSVKEGASYLNVCEGFIRNRIGRRGGPPFRRIGRKIALPVAEFMRWAEQDVIK